MRTLGVRIFLNGLTHIRQVDLKVYLLICMDLDHRLHFGRKRIVLTHDVLTLLV